MSSPSIGSSRRTTKRVVGLLLVVMFFVAYWPVGPIIEDSVSPTVFTVWVVLIVPIVLIMIFMINSYRNIQLDKQADGDGGVN